jgi:hypothetical protein
VSSDQKQHNQVDLTIKSTSGQFTDRFNVENRAQKVLDAAIKEFGLATGGGVTYSLVREADGRTLALSEKLSDLGIHDKDVLLIQTNQAQDG